jgi:hypothetical protein
MINDGKLLAIVDSQKVLSIRPGERIDVQSHVFCESQDVHLTAQNRTQEDCKNDCCPRASGHHWSPLVDIVENHPPKTTTLLPKGESCIVTKIQVL